MAGVGRYMSSTDILPLTLRNFFYKRWPIMFFYGRGSFLFWCCLKNLQCRSARFLRASSTEVVFRPTLACSHLVGQENVSPPRQKRNIIHGNWSKKWWLTSAWGDDRSRSKKKHHRMMRTWPIARERIHLKDLEDLWQGLEQGKPRKLFNKCCPYYLNTSPSFKEKVQGRELYHVPNGGVLNDTTLSQF